MKTIYILLTRSGTLLSKLVYAATGANYTHASMAFDAELSCLYSSTRKNGYTMFPAGPSKEYLNKGVPRSRVPIKQYLQKLPKWGRFGVTSVTPFLLLPVHPEGCTPAHRT